MKSGGQTKVTDIGVGRRLLCREKPSTRVKSQCAKKLKKTILAAKKGMTAKQEKLWQRLIYAPAVLQVKLFCDTRSRIKRSGYGNNAAEGRYELPKQTQQQRFKSCVNKALSGKVKFKDIFGKRFKWADYLIKGAKIIKKIQVSQINTIDPFADD
jgi:hypothetical protein